MHSWRLRRSWLQALPHQNPYLLDRRFAHPLNRRSTGEHDESNPREAGVFDQRPGSHEPGGSPVSARIAAAPTGDSSVMEVTNAVRPG